MLWPFLAALTERNACYLSLGISKSVLTDLQTPARPFLTSL
jgi:hypothetical protein